MGRRRHISGSVTATASMRQHRSRQNRKRTTWWIGIGAVGLLLLAGAALLLLRPTSGLPEEVTASQAMARYAAGALVLDVRTEAEWNQGHIAESMLIPLEELSNRLGELPRNRDIIVVCKSGARSKEAAAILRQAGFSRVTSLSGGLQGWVSAGYPLGN